MLLCSISFLLLLLPQMAKAISTEELLSDCRPVASAEVTGNNVQLPTTVGAGVCWGTFLSIQKIIVQLDDARRPLYGVCAPSTSTTTELISIFVSYAQSHPARYHEDGFSVALESLQLSFPCANEK